MDNMFNMLEDILSKYSKLEAVQTEDMNNKKYEELEILEKGNEEYMQGMKKVTNTLSQQQTMIHNNLTQTQIYIARIKGLARDDQIKKYVQV